MRDLTPLQERLETVLMEMMSEGEPVTDIARAWLQAGHSFAENVGDEEFLLHMVDLVAPAVETWRTEAKGMGATDTD
jgi:hypothetical protein